MPETTKLDLFKPQQPIIPGVLPAAPIGEEETLNPDSALSGLAKAKFLAPLLWVTVTIAGIAASGAAMLWLNRKAEPAPASVVVPTTDLSPPGTAATKATRNLPIGPGPIATASELAKSWS